MARAYRVARLRAWLAGIVGLPIQVCYFTVFYLGLKTGAPVSWEQLTALVFSLWLYLAYIVLINDLADRSLDAEAGKATVERGHGLSPFALGILLALIMLANAATVLWLGGGPVFDGLWIGAYFLGTVYSAPPFSLKRRGFLGFLADSLIEKPLPVLVVFAFFGYYGFEVLLFPVLGELLDSIFKHQVHDFEADLRTGVKTFAVALGRPRAEKIVDSFIHPLDTLLVLAAFVVVMAEIPAVALVTAAVFALMVAAFAALAYRYRSFVVHPISRDWADPPYVTYFNAGFQILLISVLAFAAAAGNIAYLPLLLLFLISVAPHLLSYGIRGAIRLGL